MDRFKFRVWDKEEKLYLQDDTLHIASNGKTYMPLIGSNGLEIEVKCKDYTIEQCTGLKDKNGNLIYEGDIVRDEDEYDVLIGDIYYEDCTFMYDSEGAKEVFTHLATSCFEIIGNIHENKELIDE